VSGWLPPGQAAPATATEPAPAAQAEPAGWWARVGATLIDALMLVAVVLAVAGLGAILGGGDAVDLVVGLSPLALTAAYAPTMLAFHRGQTVGKEACGIRVVNVSGEPIGFGRALLREVPVKALLGILPAVDSLWPLWQRENRALHDLAVGTRVVRV
jgi:uncharacterized RDD family membrane protein YckC